MENTMKRDRQRAGRGMTEAEKDRKREADTKRKAKRDQEKNEERGS